MHGDMVQGQHAAQVFKERAAAGRQARALLFKWQHEQEDVQRLQGIQQENQVKLTALKMLAKCDASSKAAGSCASHKDDRTLSYSLKLPLVWLLGDALKLLKGTASPIV